MHTIAYIYHSDFSEGITRECPYRRKRAHCLEMRRITGKYEFLKNKAMYCQSWFCMYLKPGDKREQIERISKKHSAMQKDGST